MARLMFFKPKTAPFIALIACLALSQTASANDMALLVDVTMDGNDNLLAIVQNGGSTGADPSKPNTITVNITGDRNGGYASEWFGGRSHTSFMPGDLMQSGLNNTIALTVAGDDNLFAVSQTGENNIVTGRVSGSYNQFAATQTGYGNSIGFSQTGQGNTIVVSQSSWR